MIRMFPLFVLLCMIGCQSAEVNRTFSASAIEKVSLSEYAFIKLQVNASSCDITIVASESQEQHLVIETIASRESLAEAAQTLQQITTDIKEESGTLQVTPDTPLLNEFRTKLTFIVPPNKGLSLKSDGTIMVSNMKASLSVTGGEGSVIVMNHQLDASIATTSGPIYFESNGKSAFTLLSDRGKVKAEIHKGFSGQVEATSQNGTISLKSASERVRPIESEANVMKIRVDGSSANHSTITTEKGEIAIVVP